MPKFILPFTALLLLAAPQVALANDAAMHAQAMNDIAATPPWDDGGDYYYDDEPSYSSQEWVDWSDEITTEGQPDAALMNDPRYQAFLDGEWIHTTGAGDVCSIVFMRGGVGAIIAALGGPNDPAIFLFFGMDIPAPAKTRTIKATLSQTGDKPATVDVFNSALPWNGNFGTVVFAVPTANAALGGILDTQEFGVGIGGETKAEIAWTGGNAAKAALKKCLASR